MDRIMKFLLHLHARHVISSRVFLGAIQRISSGHNGLLALRSVLPGPADPRIWIVALQSAPLGFRRRHICSTFWQMPRGYLCFHNHQPIHGWRRFHNSRFLAYNRIFWAVVRHAFRIKSSDPANGTWQYSPLDFNIPKGKRGEPRWWIR